MNSELTNYDNYMKSAPKDEDAEMKLNKFKEHLFSSAKKMSTEELLDKITNIINTTKMEEIAKRNENEDSDNIVSQINQFNRINQLNQISQIEEHNEDNNTNENRTENTKPMSEIVDQSESGTANVNNNTIMSEYSSIEPKKFRHVYRGIVYYTDKPYEEHPPKDIKKKQDEYEPDDDDDDDYNN